MYLDWAFVCYFLGELFALFEPMIGNNSMQYANGKDGRTRRNIYDPTFAHASLKYYYGTFNKVDVLI